MISTLEQNKAVVRRFNHEVIEQGNRASFQTLMNDHFVNHAAPPGADQGADGMWQTFQHLLRPAFPDLAVVIYEQLAEEDLVTTRKAITGTHTGTLLGIPPTGRRVTIDVIDIVRIRDGRYAEHWGINTLPVVLQQLAAQ
ncbi:ester cyclase (plasmid) [Deinococcus sp. KNUC1210]|uniref:ester cyclase n=1 Tax=Deinococcus sp. KNUC1210 TaxID=2917691 RepID=UPI001EEF87B3|nr:ester cyclase [Deinococcus sp. KNUC1210]ULH18155.1 ester cyclase [Deinococcus sp. KNUC1210]